MNPGIEYRYCELDRRAGWLRWLLERSTSEAESPFAKAATEGESVVVSATASTQGFPLKRNSPETCLFLCEWLQGITERQLFRAYDPELMLQAGLYKWRIPEDSLLTYECILRDFRNLKDFYERVTARREAALVIVD
jgi:hypothetical protein